MNSWKISLINSLDIAYDYFKATSKEDHSVFFTAANDYLRELNSFELEVATEEEIAEELKKQEEVKPVRRFVCTKDRSYMDKSLSDRFEGEQVYISTKSGKVIPNSVAKIVKGDTNKSRDMFRLLSDGHEYTMTEYLTAFDTPKTDIARVKFVSNAKVSLWMIKNTYYDEFKSIKDVFTYKR